MKMQRIFTESKVFLNYNLLDEEIAEVVYYTMKYEGVIPRLSVQQTPSIRQMPGVAYPE